MTKRDEVKSLLEEIKVLLSKVPPRPWSVDIVPPSGYQKQGFTRVPGDQDDTGILPQVGFDVGTLRHAQTGNVIEPWPESNSMIIALPGVLPALAELINKTQQLVDTVDNEPATEG